MGPRETCYSGANHADLHAQNDRLRSGTHGDSSFWSKSRCFASKNHRRGLGSLETSNFDANHAVLHAQNDR